MTLADAVDEGLIPYQPISRHRIERERVWATPTEVLRIGWTGCRWGELTGLRRDDVDLGALIIDPRTGSAHPNHIIGPHDHLPPFLITMLCKHLERHDNEFVFTAEGETWL
ncbi:hypothetical protein ACIRG5_26570 [Lentzea sp. NPDC102401]|uniref:hypothetical protein n=1 Tax=Lentzea sp. NPDC102401 TaxID=3364128 RepID=UPI0038156FC0